MKEFCQANQMTEAAFIRLAIIDKLNRAQYEQNNMTQSTQVQDLPTIELAIQELTSQQTKLMSSMEYLIERSQGIDRQPEFEKQVQEAKKELLENKPSTYQLAGSLITDVEIMNEAITQLLNEKQVIYKRRKLVWR